MITLLNKFDDNYVIRKEDVLEVTSKFVREHGIEPYLKDVFFTAHNDSIAAYDFTAHRMILNTEVIKKACELSYRELKEKHQIDDRYDTYFINFFYLHFIYRELAHINQLSRIERTNGKEDIHNYLYDICYKLHRTDKAFYEQNSIILPNEIRANNTSLLTAYTLMNCTKLPGKEANIMYQLYLQSLLNNYDKKNKFQVGAPIELLSAQNPIFDMDKVNELLDQSKLSKIERMNLGLPITPKEFDGISKKLTRASR